MIDWGGWTLLDYRGAPEPKTTRQIVGDDVEWPKSVRDASWPGEYLEYQDPQYYDNIVIRYVPSGSQSGSFQVSGMRAKREEELGRGLSFFTDKR